MADYSLVPVDHQPEFEDVSLVPVEPDPFGGDDLIQHAGSRFGAQPQQLETAAYHSDIGAAGKFSVGNKVADIACSGISDGLQRAPLAPSSDASKPGSSQQYSMASHAAYSKCVDKCLHLLPSPSGDLQSSEFRLCVAQCMGRL
jgi:Tim10/DDP family zinc finger